MSKQNEEFVVNGSSISELKDSLDLVKDMIEYQSQGKNITITDGEVLVNLEKDIRVSLGTLPDLSETTTAIFGDGEVPKEVEYIKLEGITFMTYKGHLIACGDGSNLENSGLKESSSTLNSILNNDITVIANQIADTATSGTLCDEVRALAFLLNETVDVLSGQKDYDNTLDSIQGVNNFNPSAIPGTGKVYEAYAEMMSVGALKKLVEMLEIDLEISGDVVLEFAKHKDRNVTIVWEDAAVQGNAGETYSITLQDICDFEHSNTEIARIIYVAYSEILDEEALRYLEEYGQIDLNKDDVIGASKAQKRDPLIIDFTGNGIYSTSLGEGAYYDYGGDGMKEKSAWAEKGDGFLVYDKNGNGIIDEAGEFFGDRTLLENGRYASDGFEALAQYDKNKDNVINSDDEIFTKLSVWTDRNGNGITDEGELQSLTELGITGIGIAKSGQVHTDINGNTIHGESVVTMEDGTTHTIASLGFVMDTMDTRPAEDIEIPDYIADIMPDLKASGNVLSLHQAMTVDHKLYSMVRSYMKAETVKERNTIAEQILVQWSGCENIQAGSRGTNVDAVHLAVIEKFYGTGFVGVDGSRNPNNSAGPALENVYRELYLQVKDNLFMQTYGISCFLYSPLEKDEESGVFRCDLTGAVQNINELYSEGQTVCDILKTYVNYVLKAGTDYSTINTEEVNALIHEIGLVDLDTVINGSVIKGGSNTEVEGTRIADIIYAGKQDTVIYGYDGDDTIYGDNGNDHLDGGEGDDILYGNNGNDYLNGGAGDDKIYGGSGNDYLDGGAGDDYLEGGMGEDTYYIGLGEGNDTINNMDTGTSRVKDKILFGEGIRPEDIEVTRNGYDMLLTNKVNGQVTRVQNQYFNSVYTLEKVEFSDGTVWNLSDLVEMQRTIKGTEGDDVLRGMSAVYGYSDNERLYGGDGNDKIYGDSGNDYLEGGAGDDFLTGGLGEDIYYIGLGDGNDTISNHDTGTSRVKDKILFGEGIRPEDMEITRNGYDMLLTNRTNGQVTRVQNQYFNSVYTLEKVEFSDGTVWNLSDLVEMQRDIKGTEGDDTLKGMSAAYGYSDNEIFYGGAGSDTIYGESGNDILIGGTGDDYLCGGSGNDTYLFNRGDGADVIYDYDNTTNNSDTLKISENAENLLFARNGSDLLVSILDSQDSVTIRNWYQGNSYRVENICANDGFGLTHGQVDQLIQSMASFESATGMSWAEGVRTNNESINNIISQVWIKQETA